MAIEGGGGADNLLNLQCTPPNDIVGNRYRSFFPKGKGRKILLDIMNKSKEILEDHDVNKVRIDLKENPANMIWFWGQGKASKLDSFEKKHGIKGAMVSASGFARGIAKLLGLDVVNVPGATGYYDTDYLGKAEFGLRTLDSNDMLIIHLSSINEASYQGDLKQKIQAIENFDSLVVGAVLKYMESNKDVRVLICPGCSIPVSIRTHTQTPVPYLLCGSGICRDNIEAFDEVEAARSKVHHVQGSALIGELLRN
jgi:2,3-bisphosphoglycerate-independent phosphoglycerate mutase